MIFAATELTAGRKAAALDALRRAVDLNPGNRRQLPKDPNFATLFADTELKKITGS